MAPRCTMAALLLLVSASDVARADDLDWKLKLEAGSEYDSNVFRLERPEGQAVDIDGSPLARLAARFRLGWRPRRRQLWHANSFVGTKLFTTEEAQSENVAVVSVGGGYRHTFPSRPVSLDLRGSYYDAESYEVFGQGRPIQGRTFSTSSVEANSTLVGRPGHNLSVGLGHRWFTYKPDPDFDWLGVFATAGYRGVIWLGDRQQNPDVASVELGVGYQLERRDYTGLAYRNQCTAGQPLEPQCSIPTDLGRMDLMHVVYAESIFTGERIYSARYQAQINDSNSFSQSFVRHRFDLGVTSELLWDVFVTARATVQVNIFLDSLLITRDVNSQSFVSIDDENRNSLSLILSRDLSKSVAVEGRYVIFSNEFATQELDFRRQTAYVGVVYNTGS